MHIGRTGKSGYNLIHAAAFLVGALQSGADIFSGKAERAPRLVGVHSGQARDGSVTVNALLVVPALRPRVIGKGDARNALGGEGRRSETWTELGHGGSELGVEALVLVLVEPITAASADASLTHAEL
jgi:hypothetical protein